MQNDKPFRKKKHIFLFLHDTKKKGVVLYGPNSIESDSGPSSEKNLGVLGQSIQFHPFLQMNTWCHFCEQNEY